ncbi:glycosyltransferase [Paenibacillus sp. AN1007]|uniref:Glycosyltransferase n=1 Tax=Paenibacillus sp. AN1007 TaxID=3151385 RepID=A0AAU8NCU6_9BACL
MTLRPSPQRQSCRRKIDYYLHHNEERQIMAWRGLLTTMNRHTFNRRITELLGHL